MRNARESYEKIIAQLNLLKILSSFQICVVGTPPLGIETENSDIDLICTYQEDQLEDLKEILSQFSGLENWSFQLWQKDSRVYICRFLFQNWTIEIFCSVQPIYEQLAYRHFHIEKRLLDLANTEFRRSILQLKDIGVKTEPAFAKVLNLEGDPYLVLSSLFDAQDSVLKCLLDENGF